MEVKKGMLLRLDPIVHTKMNLIAAVMVLGNGGKKKLSATKVGELVLTQYANQTFDKLVSEGKLSEDMLDGQKSGGGG
ncbi:hypothetical protein ACIPLR_17820 [Herbaspirillum huttiense]|uniref:hypothetical protein n=1 Tax=Herbaspirillum huttiense TaxID=863372 RepID=UPI00382492F6